MAIFIASVPIYSLLAQMFRLNWPEMSNEGQSVGQSDQLGGS